jgi:hypothetical protein
MLKKSLFILLILCITYPAFSIQKSVPALSWDEFCPEQYLNADYVQPQYNESGNMFLAMTGIGMPFAYKNKEKYDAQIENNYWVTRRDNFKKSLNLCNALSDNDKMINCYMNLKDQENNKNANHYQYQQKNEEIQDERMGRIAR